MYGLKSKKLWEFIKKYHNQLVHDSGGDGGIKSLPEYDYYARDYLEYADEALKQETESSLINCISNLKRAMDCQIDTFFHCLNLFEIFEKRNLKFEQKLKFIEEVGLFGSRSLSRLNLIRNKMEHRYEKPKIFEIELYFELVSALIRSLEMATMALSWHGENQFIIYSETATVSDIENYTNRLGIFNISLSCNEPSIEANWTINEIDENIKVTIDEYFDFAYFLKVNLLLYQIGAIGGIEKVL